MSVNSCNPVFHPILSEYNRGLVRGVSKIKQLLVEFIAMLARVSSRMHDPSSCSYCTAGTILNYNLHCLKVVYDLAKIVNQWLRT